MRRSPSLPAEHAGVTFDRFAAAFLVPKHGPRWRQLIKSIKDETPPDRWPPNLDAALPAILVNFAWASAVARPKSSEIAPPGRATRVSARRFLKDLDRLETSWAAFAQTVTDLEMTDGPGLRLAELRVHASTFDLAAPDRGGRPRRAHFDYLVALCARGLFAPLIGPRAKRRTIVRLANQVTALAISAQNELGHDLLRLPEKPEAFRKRLARIGRTKPRRQ